MAKVEKPHPMLHGHHDGKMPPEHKGRKEKEGHHKKHPDHHHDKIHHHISETISHLSKLHQMALGGIGSLPLVNVNSLLGGASKMGKSASPKKKEEEKKPAKKPARVHEEKSQRKEIKPSQAVGKEALGRLERIKKEQK